MDDAPRWQLIEPGELVHVDDCLTVTHHEMLLKTHARRPELDGALVSHTPHSAAPSDGHYVGTDHSGGVLRGRKLTQYSQKYSADNPPCPVVANFTPLRS